MAGSGSGEDGIISAVLKKPSSFEEALRIGRDGTSAPREERGQGPRWEKELVGFIHLY